MYGRDGERREVDMTGGLEPGPCATCSFCCEREVRCERDTQDRSKGLNSPPVAQLFEHADLVRADGGWQGVKELLDVRSDVVLVPSIASPCDETILCGERTVRS